MNFSRDAKTRLSARLARDVIILSWLFFLAFRCSKEPTTNAPKYIDGVPVSWDGAEDYDYGWSFETQ